MADQALTPGDGDPFNADDDSLTPRSGERQILSLRAVNAADHIMRTLSPWIRESLTGEQSPRTAGSLIRRLMRKRSGASFTFNGTVGIMRRFHRIVNRSVAWQADVGPIDPNLFDRFSLDMTRRRDIGANNIGELLKINRQEEELEMPLAGAPEPEQPTQQQPAEPSRQLTFEEIKQRIEAARTFRSQSPSGEPDFVEAMRKRAAQATEPTQASEQPSPRPAMPPAARLPQQPPAAPPTGTPPESPNPAAMSPRQRRRMGRKVEYLSIPQMDDEDGDSDGEPGPPTYLAHAPPDLAAPFPPTEPFDTSLLSPQADLDDDILIRRYNDMPHLRRAQPVRVSLPPRIAVAPRRRPATAASSANPRRSPQPQHRRSRRAPSIIARAAEYLHRSIAGDILVSRPQTLLAHIARPPVQDTRPPDQPPTVLPVIQPGPANPPIAQSPNRPIADPDLPLHPPRTAAPPSPPSLADLQIQPLRPMPTVAVRRKATMPPSPVHRASAAPILPPQPQAISHTRRGAPPLADPTILIAPVARLSAVPMRPIGVKIRTSES
ncbi:MAG: hypothetical protein KDD84_08015, partial [Caldilineaceae bacterium]|nr:hypothetical protein [Caldilineaceae bacterium]